MNSFHEVFMNILHDNYLLQAYKSEFWFISSVTMNLSTRGRINLRPRPSVFQLIYRQLLRCLNVSLFANYFQVRLFVLVFIYVLVRLLSDV